jgi:general secretion pathway protein I
MKRGFTLLEMLVATLIMGIAVVGLLSGISASMRNADRVKDYDRAVMLARAKMDGLLLDLAMPRDQVVEGVFDPTLMGGTKGGWRARLTIFELPPHPQPQRSLVERVELEIWWMSGETRRRFQIDGYRSNTIRPTDIAAIAAAGAQ